MNSFQKEQLSSETQSREAPSLAGGEDVTGLKGEVRNSLMRAICFRLKDQEKGGHIWKEA